MVEPTCEIFNQWENEGHNVEYVRCDKGEKYEFTGKNTPQRNYLAEISFHVLANKGRAMLRNARAPKASRYLLWGEAYKITL
jgi:hypothetical protein